MSKDKKVFCVFRGRYLNAVFSTYDAALSYINSERFYYNPFGNRALAAFGEENENNITINEIPIDSVCYRENERIIHFFKKSTRVLYEQVNN